MAKVIANKDIYDGKDAFVLDVVNGEQVKIQGVGSGSYTLKGRLSPDCAFDSVCAIKVSDFSKKTEITDDSIWSADVSGFAQITVEAESFDKIVAVIIG